MSGSFLARPRVTHLFTAAVLSLSLAGCGGSADEPTETDDRAGTGAAEGTDGGSGSPQGDAEPAQARMTEKGPVGLYFMTRFWPATGSLEKAAWYFAPDGTVYRDLADGFSEADLAAHAGPTGRRGLAGGTLRVTWSDGTKTESGVEPDEDSFLWDGGIFTPVRPLRDGASVAGSYEGGESLSTSAGGGAGSGAAIVSKSLELRPDGTYSSSAAASLAAESGDARASAGAAGGGADGTWELDGYSLTLTPAAGKAIRGIAFPYDDEETPIYPDRLFFRGTMFKKR